METRPQIDQMKLVGGTLVFDFLNTRGGPPDLPPDYEALHGYQDVVAWGVHAGALSPLESERLLVRASEQGEEAQSVHARALTLRRSLYDLFAAVLEGREPTPSTTTSLREDEAEAVGHADLVVSDAGFGWSWANDESLERPLWPIVHDATQLLIGGPLWRAKRCPGCGWWFLDESRNQSRRWCSMDDCGTAEKMRNYVSRRAAKRRTATLR